MVHHCVHDTGLCHHENTAPLCHIAFCCSSNPITHISCAKIMLPSQCHPFTMTLQHSSHAPLLCYESMRCCLFGSSCCCRSCIALAANVSACSFDTSTHATSAQNTAHTATRCARTRFQHNMRMMLLSVSRSLPATKQMLSAEQHVPCAHISC